MVEPVKLVAYAYPGFVVARRRPGNRIGWLLLVSEFGGVLDALGHAYAVYANSAMTCTSHSPGRTLP
ncbi:hypothetical protein ACFV98_10480 [Streptomyces violascens]|uniref:hypothetical protein n=1 Tax=Streptomyces violascens TaxID=67381 RepID=UPI003663B65F